MTYSRQTEVDLSICTPRHLLPIHLERPVMSPNMRNMTELEKHAEEIDLINRIKSTTTRIETACAKDRAQKEPIDHLRQSKRLSELRQALRLLSTIA